jgi:hypothetical protein
MWLMTAVPHLSQAPSLIGDALSIVVIALPVVATVLFMRSGRRLADRRQALLEDAFRRHVVAAGGRVVEPEDDPRPASGGMP